MINIRIRALAAAAAAACWLAACGGGGDVTAPGSGSPAGAPTTKGTFTAVVSFGDSLSDVGTYAPATATGNPSVPFFGGKFTTNGVTGSGAATIWVENLAISMGLAITPAEVGFAAPPVKCPAAACTAYGQGGSRVTDPNGIGKTGGALTVPISTQIANHLAANSSFKDSDLVLVFGGNNDELVQFSAFGAQAAQIQAQAAAGTITADEAQRQLFAAQTVAQTAVKQAAQELVGYVRTEILAKGGKYVAVINVPDLSATPLGQSLQPTARPVLQGLGQTFNLWLRDGLAGQPVLLIDLNTKFADVNANPATYGLTDISTRACDATKIAAITSNRVTDGSSLFCNATVGAPFYGLTPNASTTTWLYADSLHPTTGGHKIISDFVRAQLQAAGWL